ncbi:MAG: M48 family metallopeptidase [Lachnospiraceae bacterium]|nr:M48 family metallopeptidase [Lachnospiraceae bacterium]
MSEHKYRKEKVLIPMQYTNIPTLTAAEIKRLETLERRYRKTARTKFEQRVTYYHKITGGRFTSITIRDQKSRWGSCSSSGTLSFNYRLIFAPAIVLDYVVVHELCHLTHMNHSKDFWNMVAAVMPDYQIHRQWLRDHGHELSLEAHLAKVGIPLNL